MHNMTKATRPTVVGFGILVAQVAVTAMLPWRLVAADVDPSSAAYGHDHHLQIPSRQSQSRFRSTKNNVRRRPNGPCAIRQQVLSR